MSAQGEKAVVRPRRRWFQFSLGSLLLVMTVFGIWLGLRMDRARRQERAVAVLRERGDVQYDSIFVNMSNPKRFVRPAPYGPKWLRAIVGNDFFDRVRAVWVYKATTDDDLTYLEDLPDVESLIISSPQVTGSGLEHLRGLGSLKELILGGKNLTGADLAPLQELQELRYLMVSCPLTDEQIVSFAVLKNLEELHISPPGRSTSTSVRGAAALDEQSQLNAVEEPLNSVLDYFKDLHHIEITIDEATVQATDINADEIPITININKQPFERVLDAILDDSCLDWILTPNGITITTKEKAAAKLAVVRDLKRRLPSLKRVVYVVAP